MLLWSLGETLADVEKKVILEAFQRLHRNKTRTAQALDIAVRTLDAKLASYEAEKPSQYNEEMLKRKIQYAMAHFFGNKARVAENCNLSLAQLEEKLKGYRDAELREFEEKEKKDTSENTDGGVRVESTKEVSTELPVSMRKTEEVQSVLPAKHAGDRAQGNSKR
jgi:DNA-binding NtrC family response regulator